MPDRVRVQPRQVKQLLQQAAQPLTLVDARSHQFGPQLLRQLVSAARERRQHAVDGRRRRAELVRRDRDEIRFQLVKPDGLLVQLRPLNRNRDAVRHHLEQFHVVLCERTVA